MAAVVQSERRSEDRASLAPYGQLIKMVLPRARNIAVYGADMHPLWVASGQDDPDLQAFGAECMGATIGAPFDIDGFSRAMDGAAAYAFRLRDEHGLPLAAVALLADEKGTEPRPFSLILSLVRPALECLTRELGMRASIGAMSRDLSSRDRDLELLLDVSREEGQSPKDADELGRLVQSAVEHLDCAIGALIIPEKSVAVVRARKDSGTGGEAQVVTRTHRHLMTWAQLQRRTMVVNRIAAGDKVPPFKILSVPVRHLSHRVIGFLALFNPAEAADFGLRHTRLAELLARKVTSILLTSFDAATGLATRAAFEQQVSAVLAANQDGGENAIVYLDLDHLHVTNENFGMHVGDEVIAKVAETVRRRAPVGALCARISGDRFTVFLPGATLDTAAAVAEELRAAAAEHTQNRGNQVLKVSLSAGVAEFPQGSRQPLSHALASAEIACKIAKDRGRNRIERYRDADQMLIRRHEDVQEAVILRNALANNRFTLYAQPILPLAIGPAEPRFEILLRMLAENGEVLPPAKWMSSAERAQMMPAIDRWVVDHTFEALHAHRSILQDRLARFAINLSGQSIGDEALLQLIEKRLGDSGIPADLICFELTEIAAVADLDRAEAFMQRLRTIGCQFALDDFGTGASSLAYLKSLPVSVLKIDGTFVRDVLTNPRSDSMVKAIAQLARTMGMTTVAEYVETDELRVRMANLGVDFGQGFAIGKPMALVDVLQDLSVYAELAQSASGGEPTLLAG
jgi:diguanylate cyclase (GGDEF)-like protein